MVRINIAIFRESSWTMVVIICQFPPSFTKIRESSRVNSLGMVSQCKLQHILCQIRSYRKFVRRTSANMTSIRGRWVSSNTKNIVQYKNRVMRHPPWHLLPGINHWLPIQSPRHSSKTVRLAEAKRRMPVPLSFSLANMVDLKNAGGACLIPLI